jgi:hypothetical protein
MSVETFAFDNLIGGSQKPIVQRDGTVAAGQSCARGTLVGKLTSSGKWQLIDFQALASYDDVGITVEALDTTGGETNSTFYVEGEFNENGVTFGYGDDADDWRETLADHGIYLRTSVSTAGV